MKMTAVLIGVVLAGSLSSSAAPPPKGSMLMRAESFAPDRTDYLLTVARGSATAMIGNFSVTADEITFDQREKRLICRGVKSITPGFAAPEAKDVTLTVDVDNAYRLNPAGVVTESQPIVQPAEPPFPGHVFTHSHSVLPKPAPSVPTFLSTFPKLNLDLSARPLPTAP